LIVAVLLCFFVLSSMAHKEEEHVWAIQVHPSSNVEDIAQRHGFEVVGPIGLADHYLLRLKSDNTIEDVELKGSALLKETGVLWGEKQAKKERVRKPDSYLR